MSALPMHTERTPDPASVKWVLGRPLAPDGRPVSFAARPDAGTSPLAARLMAIAGVERVLIGEDFVTVSKAADAGWRELGQAVSTALREWDASGESVLGPDYEPPPPRDDDEVVARIRQILDEEVAPYVAQDGGEITLAGFEDGEVRVVLRGACQGCPSSTITLKMGIEARLREAVPEVRSVTAVDR